ncbi:pyridoxal phosphate-dependent decarboxylase family protein [Marinobacter bohaiensis]|uniref:pyridoxal phosphate-dependent decarboxylase family protein n=1 Tax=Marinobacter bohaiensis TaxID=2201898 RepID=UPI000DABE276|nr:aspartate aminotransferase family protein [Marinobacter bohaiensis]
MMDHSTPLQAAQSETAFHRPDPLQYLFNADQPEHYRTALEQGIQLIQRRLALTERPFTGILPGELAERFRGLDLDQPLEQLNDVLGELESLYLQDAVYFHHPRYVAHLNCPIVVPAILAELILSSVNTSVDTWDQSAGATLIEQSLIDWTTGRIGLGDQADGVFTSGGTQSNLMAMLVARDNACERLWGHSVRERGLPPEAARFRIFCSEVSHFSIQKAAALLGLGYDAVVPVACDDHFRMDPHALHAALDTCARDGKLPLAVVATAGTTDFGSIDPLPRLAEITRNSGAWFHVDAAYGCGLLLSRHHRQRLGGIEQADSVTVDYHKSFFQPVSCSALLVRDRARMGCVTWHADYLNPLSQRQEGTPNLVDKSLQTTRRFDALKLWLTLRTMGPDALGDAFEQVMALARKTYLLLLSDERIEVLHQPEISTLVFRFRPGPETPDAELDAANVAIRKAIMRSGEAMVAATKVGGRQYLKFTLLNPATRIQDIQAVLRLIKQHGEDFFADRSEAAADSTTAFMTDQEVAHG